jgi:hypothetical protein
VLGQVPGLEQAKEKEPVKEKELVKVLEMVQGPEMEGKVQALVQMTAVLYLRHQIARLVESQGPAPELVPEV